MSQYIGSSSLIEFGSNNEKHKSIQFPSKSIKSTNNRVSINNVGHAVPWRELSLASSFGPNNKQESSLPRFSLRSIKNAPNNVRPHHQTSFRKPSGSDKNQDTKKIASAHNHSSHAVKVVESDVIDNVKSACKIFSYSIMLCAILIALIVGIDQTIRPATNWRWSGQRQRNLKGRNCVLNFFIDKHSRNEYDPDFGTEDGGRGGYGGTYWTKGKFKVISRFISSVSGTFRHKIHVKQHLIFAGVRDGGYLAQQAFESWPKRGSKFSEVHIIAADVPNVTDSLEYSYLDEVESRFHTTHNVHIYDRKGLAGEKEVFDDDGFQGVMSSFEEGRALIRNRKETITHSQSNRIPYPNLSSFIKIENDGPDAVDTELVIPYLHVDGLYMADQLEILMSAVPLLKSKTIVSVGVEHSPDMNVLKLIKFFDSVEYKTFFLGSRQLARIDNLCPETLYDVLTHPYLEPVTPTWSSLLLDKVGLSYHETASPSEYKTPPFFVAFPRGRINKEEMSIQHAYDLFGGIDGEKNVKTANDRINK